MKIPKFKKIFKSIRQFPVKQSFRALIYLPKVFSKFEKIALISLTVILVALIGIVILKNWLITTKNVATNGGEYREGIVGSSKDFEKHLARLTNAGLTKYDINRNIVGDLADRWEIKDNGKTYEFHLREGFRSEDLAAQIIAKNMWKDVEVSTPDPTLLDFKFKTPLSPFLNVSTEPIFNYGPYRISKEDKNEVELTARDDYYAGKPFIDKIKIKLYANNQDILKASKRGDLDGVAINSKEDLGDKFDIYEVSLPRDLILFFNLNNKTLQDVNVRKALKEGTSPGKEFELRLVTPDIPHNIELAKTIQEKWSKVGVKVNLDIKDNVTLLKTTIPKRDYDVLLYGLDYGADPDPYPFWHSSQATEQGENLSNFKNTQADKLLESARMEYDYNKRNDMYAQFQKILDDFSPMFVVEHYNFYYYISKNIQGVNYIFGTKETDRFIDNPNWFIETKRVRK